MLLCHVKKLQYIKTNKNYLILFYGIWSFIKFKHISTEYDTDDVIDELA